MKKLQSGRSMIEMLGVLAIIGVLSIGGLAGYTMAMNRHRANTVLDYVNRAFVSVQTQGNGTDVVNEATCASFLDNEALALLATCNGERDANGVTTVTFTFGENDDNIADAVASRIGLAETPASFVKASNVVAHSGFGA